MRDAFEFPTPQRMVSSLDAHVTCRGKAGSIVAGSGKADGRMYDVGHSRGLCNCVSHTKGMKYERMPVE